MKHWQIKLSLFINYFVFAILLNSVGTVILQVQNNFGVTKVEASILEACKDLSIAIFSFAAAFFFTQLGYKKAMLLGLAIVAAACLITPIFPSFATTKLLFVAIGISFALIKMSVYSTIGLVTENEKEHISLMNFIESFFMVGILVGNILFANYVKIGTGISPTFWFSIYYVLGGLSLLAFVLLLFAPLDESKVEKSNQLSLIDEIISLIKILVKPAVLIFVFCAFFFVLMEQSIMNWLPTFNNEVLKIPVYISIMAAALMSLSAAVGRFLAGILSRHLNWYLLLTVCLVLASVLILTALPLANGVDASAITSFWQLPLVAWIFPLIGLLIAPIYPAINSLILNVLPKKEHGQMSSLIIIFSALGGTLGSRITGFIFERSSGTNAFYFSLIPIAILLVLLFFFRRLLAKVK
jgi:MFS transporter, FHS family, glucose/mannose:H+ symporter